MGELIGEVFGTFILILLGDGVVANVGLDMDDLVVSLGNPLDCTEQAANIQALEDRGVMLLTECGTL